MYQHLIEKEEKKNSYTRDELKQNKRKPWQTETNRRRTTTQMAQ